MSAERFIEDILDNQPTHRAPLLWYITRRLSDPFIASVLGGTQTLMIDDSRVGQVRGVQRARRFLSSVSHYPISGIVTPNYDLLIEYALTTKGFNYGAYGEVLYGRGKNPLFPWQGAWPILLGRIPIAKIHGSISWDRSTRYTDGRAGVKGDALIVAPRPEKTPSSELESMWALAAEILSRASKLLVFGFAFNPYDVALLELLKSAGSAVKDVIIVDIVDHTSTAKSLWPDASVQCCVPPNTGSKNLAAWMAKVWYVM